MNKQELIEELRKHHWSSDGTIGYDWSDEIADFILSRERLLLEKIGKPLREAITIKGCPGNWTWRYQEAIENALAIIEKEGL